MWPFDLLWKPSSPLLFPEYDKNNPETWPSRIKMSGLPLNLQGWNCTFYRKGLSEGEPVYVMDSYTLYLFFPIIGASIRKYKGSWILQRECDELGYYFIFRLPGPGYGPKGEWSLESNVINVGLPDPSIVQTDQEILSSSRLTS